MNRVAFCFALAGLLLLPSGCKKYEPTPEQITSTSAKIRSVTEKGVSLGLKQWALKNPELAKEVAKQLVKNIDEVVMPYLDKSSGVAASVLEAFIQQNMLKDLPPDVQNLISMAASVLDAYLPAPAPDVYMKPWQLAYIKAFLQGVSQGASGYANAVVDRDTKPYREKRGKWFTPVVKNDTWQIKK